MATCGHPLGSPEPLPPTLPSQSLAPASAAVPTLAPRPARASASPRTFSMAFQPVVDLDTDRIVIYEALVRGHGNEPAATVLSSRGSGRGSIDRACRLTAIEIASALGVLQTGADLSINVNARGAQNDIPSLPATIAAAECACLPLDRLILEITEQERLKDPRQLESTVARFRERGLRIAIDDFGAGFAGLSLLAAFRPDILKIDIALTRDIHTCRTSRVIVRSVVDICRDLSIQLVAEGVENSCQRDALQQLGIRYMQGHFFAAPAFESLPKWPVRSFRRERSGKISRPPLTEPQEMPSIAL